MKLSNILVGFSFVYCFGTFLHAADIPKVTQKPTSSFPLSTKEMVGLATFIGLGGFICYRFVQIRRDRNPVSGNLNWFSFSTIEKIRYGIFGKPFTGYRKYLFKK
ncbi:MAG TPA: hypothetical protein VGW78_00435 [Candidatus Babeliales bacterium]|jgi:hypothetical protein|nr:hypothetical protein [Candidatus Babeliales bacterium]